MDRPGSHSQRVPYARKEGRKSLFSKVKDSVKDMLSPSWLSDLVNNVKKDAEVEATEKKQQDIYKGPVSPAQRIPQPDMQQQTTNLPFQNQGIPLGNGQPHMMDFANRGPIPPNETMPLFQQPIIPPPVSEFTSSQLPLARLTEKSDSVLANDDSVSQRSDASKSTSGCSSMVPQADAGRRSGGLEKRKVSEPEIFSGGSSPSSPTDQPAKRQRLQVSINSSKTWTRGTGDLFSKPQAAAAFTRPSFNASLFGSPLTQDDSSLLGSSFHESSFYPGKTTFGGRSSMSFRAKSNKIDLNQSLPARLSIPVKAFMKAKPKINPSKEAVTSSTAKRILDALDKMPTPLNDAKRIPMPVPKHWTENPSFFSRHRVSSHSGPPTQKLNISSLATISQNRQVTSSPLRSPAASATSQQHDPSERVLLSRDDTINLGDQAGAPSGKMRRDKSYHRGSAAVAGARQDLGTDDTVIIPNLATDFTLPVVSMPKLNFASPGQTMMANTPNKPALNFTFSSPIAETIPANKPKSPETKGGFQFSSPINVDKQGPGVPPAPRIQQEPPKSMFTGSQNTANPTVPKAPFSSSQHTKSTDMLFSFSSPAAPKPKAKVNGPVLEPEGIQPPSQLKQGSVMDILGRGSSPSGSGFAPASELKQGSVMDILGGSGFRSDSPKSSLDSSFGSSKPVNGPAFGMPDQNKDKQTAASTPKTAPSSSSLPPLSSMFSSAGWSCEICLVKNKSDDAKCVACQTPKPASAQKSKQDNAFAPPLSSLFKSAGWTCDACLVKNKADAGKCIACQSAKPDASANSANSAPPPLSSAFKSQGWTCNVCLVSNKQEAVKCVACQADKPGASVPKSSSGGQNDWSAKFKPATGQWECEVCLVRNKADLTSCAACQTPKPQKAFKHPPGDWTCDTCLVNNKESSVKCVACSYARPGPPRTQTVPSCVKTFTTSQSGTSKDDGKALAISVSSGGGFTFIGGEKSDSDKGGFKFGVSNSESSKGSPGSSAGGGFRLGASTSSSGLGFKLGDTGISKNTSGFKFGESSSSGNTSLGSGVKLGEFSAPKNQTTTGGFKFGSSASTEEKPTEDSGKRSTGGFKFGVSSAITTASSSISSEKKSTVASLGSTAVGGFSFGQTNADTKTASSTPAVPGGFSFGQKSDNKKVDPLQATTSVPGGFSIKPSDSVVSAKVNDSSSQPTSLGGNQSMGGFSFSATSTSDNTANTTVQANSVTSVPTGGFSFSATKSTQSGSVTGSEPALTNSKPAFGGFSFGSPAANTSQPTVFGGFNFAQKPAESSAGSNNKPSGSNSSLKRDRDEDSGATEAKKSLVTFGATPASNNNTPFQFGAGNNPPATVATASTSSAAPFVFGQSSASSSTFSFTANQPSATPSPVFGAGNSTAQSGSAAPAFGATFNFSAQKTDKPATTTSSSLFVFGTQQPSSGAAPAFGSFGSTSSSFGAATNSAFGGNAPSTTPAFGSTPPAFGSSNTNPAAPTFGGFSFNKTESSSSGQAAPAQNSSPFQFGAKPAEASQVNVGFNFNATAGGSQPSFNFGASTGAVSFSAQPSGMPQSDRKIKKAVRKIKR